MIIVDYYNALLNSQRPKYSGNKQLVTTIEYDGVPFRPLQTKTYDCQHGKYYYKQPERKTKRLCLQTTKKMGCPVHMTVKEYHLYPDYRITEEENKSLKVHEIRQLKRGTLLLIKH